METAKRRVFEVSSIDPCDPWRSIGQTLIEAPSKEELLEELKGRGFGTMGTDQGIKIRQVKVFTLERIKARHPRKDKEHRAARRKLRKEGKKR